MQSIKIFLPFLFVAALAACNDKPKVIEGEAIGGEAAQAPIFSDVPPAEGSNPAGQQPLDAAMHKVVAQEVLNTDKYTYIKVTENSEEFWVAILKRDIKIGGTYLFTGGLLKRNFQSQEFNRSFDKVYLVSDFREEGEASPAAGQASASAPAADVSAPTQVAPAAGAIKIADLVANLKKYDGKQVKVTGKVVKINPMIMGRNWLHVQDGSGKNLDLTVTTTEQVQLGAIVTLEGTLTLNKDFGAGYKYDYILEAAVLK